MGFVSPYANVEAVRSICERLDGLPLAIELAAAQMRLRIPIDADDRLGGLPRCTGPHTGQSIERHRTLTAAIGWSYERLSTDEQQLFRQLSTSCGTNSGNRCRCDERIHFNEERSDTQCSTRSLTRASSSAFASVSAVHFRLLESVRLFAAAALCETSGRARGCKATCTHTTLRRLACAGWAW